jgi:hypothetical protein
MADKRNSKDSVLVNTAKAIGAAAGKVVSLVGGAPDETPPKPSRKGKLAKKNNPHLPRRLKKANKKAAARKALKS